MPSTELPLLLPLAVLAAVLVAGAAGVDRAWRARDGEHLFWTGFSAFLGVLLTAAWVIAAAPARSAEAGIAVVAGCAGAAGWVGYRHRRRSRRRNSEVLESAMHALLLRHREVLSRWGAYELDPWLAARYPRLLDVRVPETRDFIRALKEAGNLRTEAASEAGLAAYGESVDRLEDALSRAEDAARDGRAA